MSRTVYGIWVWLMNHIDHVPFLFSMVQSSKELTSRVNVVRIVEAVVIAAVISAAGYFLMVPKVIEAVTLELKYIRRDVDQNALYIREMLKEHQKIIRSIDRNHPIKNGESSHEHDE